jgi:hypothetical protein
MPDDHEQERSTAPPPNIPGAPPSQEAQRDQDDWRERAESAERELAIRRAIQSVDWFDPEDAYRELARHASRDADGNWRIAIPGSSAEAAPLPPADAARELAAQKPHWVRARILGGSGAGTGTGGGGAASVTYAELLKPENREKLQQFIHDRPEDLERLRQAHFKRS